MKTQEGWFWTFRSNSVNTLKIYANTVLGYYIRKYFFSIYFPYRKKNNWKHYFQMFLTFSSASIITQVISYPLSTIRNKMYLKNALICKNSYSILSELISNGYYKTLYNGFKYNIYASVTREFIFIVLLSQFRDIDKLSTCDIILGSCLFVNLITYPLQTLSKRIQTNYQYEYLPSTNNGIIQKIKHIRDLYRGGLFMIAQRLLIYGIIRTPKIFDY
mgnify:CR=1 FL=1